MKVQLLFATLLFWVLGTFAQPTDAVEVKGFLQKKSVASPCLGAKQNHYLETSEGLIDLDFSKWKSLMDIRAYLRQPVVITGVWHSQNDPTASNTTCKWVEVKDIHFDIDIPEKQKPVSFQELSGYRLLNSDKNPHNDYMVIVSQGDFNRYFASAGKNTAIDFHNSFVVAVVKSSRRVSAFKNPTFFLREKDNALKFSYDTEPGSSSISDGVSTYVIYAVDKVDYKELIFEENKQGVHFTKTHWKDYEQPAKVEKPFSYKETNSFRIKSSQRKDGHLLVMTQTLTEFDKYFEKMNIKDDKTQVNFVNEFVIAVGKTSKNAEQMTIQDVTIEGRTIRVRYTTKVSGSPMAFPTFTNKILIMKKVPFDTIIFEENGNKVGEIKREFSEIRVTE